MFEVDSRQFFIRMLSLFRIHLIILYIHRGKYPLYISSLHSSGKISSLYARCRSLASRNEQHIHYPVGYHFLEFIFLFSFYFHHSQRLSQISFFTHLSGEILYLIFSLYILYTFIRENIIINILFIYPLYIHPGKYSLYISSLHSSGKIFSLYARYRSLASRNEQHIHLPVGYHFLEFIFLFSFYLQTSQRLSQIPFLHIREFIWVNLLSTFLGGNIILYIHLFTRTLLVEAFMYLNRVYIHQGYPPINYCIQK